MRQGISPESASILSLDRLAAAYHYLAYSDRIDGWMYQTTGLAMMELLWHQEAAGLSGNIAEIGTYHGLSALALIAAARDNERMFAIDLFEQQHLNVDNSGRGDLSAFQRHLHYLFPRAHVSIIAKSSLELRGVETEYGLSNLRFFSIDGGHTKAIMLNDLEIANASLAEHGVACVDDVFNTQWTGVVSGLFQFLDRKCDLVPFAFFPNKLFLCRAKFTDFYAGACRTVFDYALQKCDLEFHDYSIDLYGDRWPFLPKRLASSAVRAAAASRVSLLEQSPAPVRRPWLQRPSDKLAPTDLRERLMELEQRCEHTEQRLEQRCKHAEHRAAAEAQLQEMVLSLSWRITAPLRQIKQWLARRRH
jgi:hypothetical protein